MAERKRDDDAKDAKDARGGDERARLAAREAGDLRPIVGTPGATPPLSAQPSVTTTPITVSGEQAGGTILLDTGQVAYTHDGAVPAVPGGPPDPTIIPGQFEAPAPPPEGGAQGAQGVRMIDRASTPDGSGSAGAR
jgi:hypothetical protein